jgi:hypothetical protein
MWPNCGTAYNDRLNKTCKSDERNIGVPGYVADVFHPHFR